MRFSVSSKLPAALLASLSALVLLSGCQQLQAKLFPSTTLSMNVAHLDTPEHENGQGTLARGVAESAGRQQVVDAKTPKPPAPVRNSTVKAGTPAGSDEKANITLMFDQLPLPTFIQVVYGSILKKNYQVDPVVAARKDLVTIRAAQPQTASQIADTARMLLKSYGIAVLDMGGGFYRIMPDNTQAGYLPEIRRGRAMPEVPLPMRPVFQLVELSAVRAPDVSNWLRTMFGQRVTVTEDLPRNAVMLSGQSDAITAAMEAIQVLDQPQMRGRQSVRLSPAFWSADELTRRLIEILNVEGYQAAQGVAAATYPISFVPINAINVVLVFAADPAVLNHVLEWARSLDQPSRGNGGGFFTYAARYTDAKLLAQTMDSLLSGSLAAAAAATPAASGQAAQGTARKTSRVVVNTATNTLIFQGGADEYTQILNLLQELDRPARSALIEVTVAEVQLDDSTALGVEWAFKLAGINGSIIQGGTLGNLGIGKTGLTVARISNSGDTTALIQALATNNRANILSSPRVMARNGETATIQVGQEVPVISSQQTTNTSSTTNSNILQTIQYRNTGVILKVKPVIHSGDRVELEVSQEVSAAATTTTGVSASPTFSTRKVETRLTLRDGATILLGGLISGNTSGTESGVPLLKDIPVLGQAFRVNTDMVKKTELLIMITPYVISDDQDAEAITDAFKQQLGTWAGSMSVGRGRPAAAGGLKVAPSLAMPPAATGGQAAVPSGREPAPVVPEAPVVPDVQPASTSEAAPATEEPAPLAPHMTTSPAAPADGAALAPSSPASPRQVSDPKELSRLKAEFEALQKKQNKKQ